MKSPMLYPKLILMMIASQWFAGVHGTNTELAIAEALLYIIIVSLLRLGQVGMHL